MLQKALQKHGLTTYISNHGLEALEFLNATSFCRGRESDGLKLGAVLMDVEMPVMDGLECTRRIRELERAGAIVGCVPIVGLTANARVEFVGRMMGAGMVSLFL